MAGRFLIEVLVPSAWKISLAELQTQVIKTITPPEEGICNALFQRIHKVQRHFKVNQLL